MIARVLVVLALAVLGCASSGTMKTWERPGLGGAVRPDMGSPQPGEAAPDFSLPDLEGRAVTLSSMRGSWVVVHFTATWCPFCDTEIPHLGELAVQFAPRGVRTIVVDVEEDAATWRAYAAKHVPPPLLALHDSSGASAARFAPPRAQPSFEDRAQAVLDSTLVIDPRGTIQLFLLPDSAHFDPTFAGVRAELDRLVPHPVIEASAAPASLAKGERGEIVVTLRIDGEHHVMSDRPTEPTHIPTRVAIDPGDGVEAAGDPRYPAPRAFSLGDRSIATFAGTIEVRVPIAIAADAAPGTRRVHMRLRYQACTRARCLFPVTRTFDATVDVR